MTRNLIGRIAGLRCGGSLAFSSSENSAGPESNLKSRWQRCGESWLIRTDPEERIGGWLSRAGRFTKARSPPDLHTQLALIVLGLSQSVLCQTNDRAEQDL